MANRSGKAFAVSKPAASSAVPEPSVSVKLTVATSFANARSVTRICDGLPTAIAASTAAPMSFVWI